jgi:stress response protein SCP2
MQKELKNLHILAIQVQDRMSKSRQRQFINMHNISYQVVDNDNANDFVYSIMKQTGWQGSIPFAILFDKNGIFIQYFQGMLDFENVKSAIK